MKPLYTLFFLTGIIGLLLASCENDYGPRKESTPVLESASISPASFTFGDSVTLTARVSDPGTTLTILAYEVVSEGRTITAGEIPIGGEAHDVSQAIFVPLLNNQADNADVQVNLIAWNVLKGTAPGQVTGLTGNRPVYSQLYMVTDDGDIITLQPQAADKNKFQAVGLTHDTSLRFKIAEKLHADNTIDYTGDVYGNKNGRIGMINERGESAFAYAPSSDYTKEVAFDGFGLNVTTVGSELGDEDLILTVFTPEEINGESFHVLDHTLENGTTYSLFGELANEQIIYNPDFFERTAHDKITFLGQTGDYTIYYNPVRQNVFVGVDNPSYPDFLLACGFGLGYPTRVTSAEIASVYPDHRRTHTDWGFDHVMKYVLFRQIDEGVYQGTFYTPADHDHYAGFKPFENTGWGNEKKAGDFTFTGEQIISGDNDWTIPNGDDDPVIESANYRFTINLNNNTVHIEKVTL